MLVAIRLPTALRAALFRRSGPASGGSKAGAHPGDSPGGKPVRQGLPYLPGVDGLRALAVLAVLLYHSQLPWMAGGFLGVDVFFVISGYLITSLLLAEWRQRGRIDLPAFWLRRARRLLPALFLLIGVTLGLAIALLPDEVAGLRSDAAAAMGYVTNWYLVFSHKSYFEIMGRPSLFRHLWSLAVEEQFYILWPPIFAFLMWLWRPRYVLMAVLAGALASTVLMALQYRPEGDPSRVYYGTDTRGVGLLAGAALAFLWAPGRLGRWASRARVILLDVVGLAALGGLAYFFVRLDGFQPLLYRGGFALVALTSAVLIAVTVHPHAHLGRVLDRQPLRWLGLRSYGVYLWHWPVFMVTRPQLDVPIDGLPLLALRLAITLVVAEISYRLVEMPIRTGVLRRAWKALREAQGSLGWRVRCQWAGATAAVLVSFAVVGLSVVGAQRPAPPSYLSVGAIHMVVSDAPSPAATSTGPAVGSGLTAGTAIAKIRVVVGAPQSPQPTIEPTLLPPATPTAEATSEPPPSADAPAAEPTTEPAPPPTDAAAEPTPEPDVSPAAEPVTETPPPSTPSPEIPALDTPPPADAGQESATPEPTPPESPPEPPPTSAPPEAPTIWVTAMGDSVMLGAASVLAPTIGNIEVDAAVGRQVSVAIEILRSLRDAGRLGDVVVVHMGNNGTFTKGQFDDMMGVLADVRRVVFVNLKVPRDWEGPNNDVLAEGVTRYPNAVLVDWHAASVDRPDFFWDDGIHLRPEGAQFYADLIASYVNAP